MTLTETIAEIERLLAEATPGPWQWRNDYGRAELICPRHGTLLVMDCVRCGMQKAEPRFAKRNPTDRGGIMIPLSKWDCDPPDAALIVALVNAAPQLIEAAKRAESADRWKSLMLQHWFATKTSDMPPGMVATIKAYSARFGLCGEVCLAAIEHYIEKNGNKWDGEACEPEEAK